MNELLYSHLKNIYIPEFIHYPKDRFPDHKFIKTIDCGESRGHILKGKDSYFLCLRQTEEVSCSEFWPEPLGYRRSTLEECETFANDCFYRYNQENYQSSKRQQKPSKLVENHYRRRLDLVGMYFVETRTNRKVEFTTFRHAAAQMRLGQEMLRLAVKKKKTNVGGYAIVYPPSFSSV